MAPDSMVLRQTFTRTQPRQRAYVSWSVPYSSPSSLPTFGTVWSQPFPPTFGTVWPRLSRPTFGTVWSRPAYLWHGVVAAEADERQRAEVSLQDRPPRLRIVVAVLPEQFGGALQTGLGEHLGPQPGVQLLSLVQRLLQGACSQRGVYVIGIAETPHPSPTCEPRAVSLLVKPVS